MALRSECGVGQVSFLRTCDACILCHGHRVRPRGQPRAKQVGSAHHSARVVESVGTYHASGFKLQVGHLSVAHTARIAAPGVREQTSGSGQRVGGLGTYHDSVQLSLMRHQPMESERYSEGE